MLSFKKLVAHHQCTLVLIVIICFINTYYFELVTVIILNQHLFIIDFGTNFQNIAS